MNPRSSLRVLLASGVLMAGGCKEISGLLGTKTDADEAEGEESGKSEPGTPAGGEAEAESGAAGDGDAADGAAGSGKVAWQIEFGSPPDRLAIADDGTVVVVHPDRVVGLRDGKEVWKKDGSHKELVRLGKGRFAAAQAGSVFVFDAASGEEVVRVEAPGKTKDGSTPAIVAMATKAGEGARVLVATATAKFYWLDPAKDCADAACLEPSGSLAGEYLEQNAVLMMGLGEEAEPMLLEDDVIRVFDANYESRLSVTAGSPFSSVVPVIGGRLGAVVSGDLLMLDLGACAGQRNVQLERESSGIGKCVMWRYRGGIEEFPPAVLDENTFVVNGDARLQAVFNGDDLWKLPIDSHGRVVMHADKLFTLAESESDSGAVQIVLRQVAADAPTRMGAEVELPFVLPAGEVLMTDTLALEQSSQHLVAGFGNRVAVVEL